jgi:hypothetical protein
MVLPAWRRHCQVMFPISAQGSISKEQFVGNFTGRTIADLVTDAEAGALYLNLHNRFNPSVSVLPPERWVALAFYQARTCRFLSLRQN